MAEKSNDTCVDNGSKSLPLSVESTTTDNNSTASHEDTFRSELNYIAEDEDNNPLSSLEPTIDYQPDLNLLASLTDDSLEDFTTSNQLYEEPFNMYGGFFDDNYYTRNNSCNAATNNGHRTTMEPSRLHEHQQMTNPYPYRWWSSLSYPTADAQQSGMSNAAAVRAHTFHNSPLCHGGVGEPIPQYAGSTSTFMLDEPHSALTATMTYSDVPRIKLQTFYGMSHIDASRMQTSRSYVYPLVSQSLPPTPPPPPYGAFHSTMMHNTTPSGVYPTHHSHCAVDMGMTPVSGSGCPTVSSPHATNSQDFHSHYHHHQQSSMDTGIANRRQNILGDSSSKERYQQTVPMECYPSTSIATSTNRHSSNVQNCPGTHSTLTELRSTVPSCDTNYTCAQTTSSLEEYERASVGGGLQSKDTFRENIETVHSTSSQDMLENRVNPTIASVLERLESANCLLDLSKQNEPITGSRGFFGASVERTSTNAVDTPMTNTFTQSSPRTIVSCGIHPTVLTNQQSHNNTTSPLQTLPSFSSQFGTSCSSCVDPKKRKCSTVRELLQEKSKKKILALIQPITIEKAAKPTSTSVSQSAPCTNVTTEECRIPISTVSNCASTLGSYPRHTLSLSVLQPPRSKNPPPYPRRDIRFTAPVSNRKPTPVCIQPIPVVFIQNLRQSASDKQALTNWQVMLQNPSVRHDVVRLPLEARSAAAVARSLEPTTPRHSLLREALSGGLRSYGGTNKSQVPEAISMPILVPVEKDTSTNCIKTLLTCLCVEYLKSYVHTFKLPNKPHPKEVAPSEVTNPTSYVKEILKIDFRPQHYEMDLLQIGSYVVKNSPGTKHINKFKILFAKKKFVYDFQVVNVGLPNHNRAVVHTAIIDVPFNIINAIHCNDQEILIAVNQTPELFLSCKRGGGRSGDSAVFCDNHFERGRKTDITGGILRTNHLHKIYLLKCRAEMLRTAFETFDPGFKIKMQTPILEVIEIATNLENPERIDTQTRRQRIVEVIQPVVATAKEAVVANRTICHCQVSCRSNRCSCMKNRNKCGRGSSGCSCKSCNNPLNVLDSMGINTEDCATDDCLIQNIVFYKGSLKELLKRKVSFPCCDIEVTIKECIPGKVRCPNKSCNGLYKYSWCDAELQDEEKEPRNHCTMCRTCQGCFELHCNSCRRCNPIEKNGVECPDCNSLRDTTMNEIRDIANILLLLANSVDRTEDDNDDDKHTEEHSKEKGSSVLNPRNVRVEVVNVDDSEDIESVGLRAPDAINEIEVEGGELDYDRLNNDQSQELIDELQPLNGREDDDEEEEEEYEGSNVG